jgi:hypothetical protein
MTNAKFVRSFGFAAARRVEKIELTEGGGRFVRRRWPALRCAVQRQQQSGAERLQLTLVAGRSARRCTAIAVNSKPHSVTCCLPKYQPAGGEEAVVDVSRLAAGCRM